MPILFAQLQPFTLAGSGTTIGDTSLTVNLFTDINGNQLSMADFGSKGYGTLEPGSAAQEEQISFTGVVLNPDGSTTLTGVSSVDFLYPYTETPGLQKIHAGGVRFVISNTSGFYDTFANKEDDGTINGTWTFDTTPLITNQPTLNEEAANKEYVDSVAVSGAPNANETTKGIVQLATNAQMGTATSVGSTGARLVPPNDQLTSTSAGAGSANKIPTLNAGGKFDVSILNGTTYNLMNVLWTFDAGTSGAFFPSPTDPANPATKNYVDKLAFGDGSDGTLSISSGTTTLNTAGKNVYQYLDLSITGTAQLAFGSNLQNVPIFILVQNNLTITASGTSVLAKGLGGNGGTGGTNPNDNAVSGTTGSTAPSANSGARGVRGGGNSPGAGGGGGGGYGNAGSAGSNPGSGSSTPGAGGASWSLYNVNFPIVRAIGNAFIGGGGGGGAAAIPGGNGSGGAGGNGGPCLIFLVGGNINLTTGTIDCRGNDGTAGTSGTDYGGGGGGGGGGGFCGIYYAGSVTANTITRSVSGGAGASGGSGGATSGSAGGNGGNGQSEVRQIKLYSLPL